MTPETLLWRQAHPSFMDGEKPTSQVFLPFPKDEGNLSVYNSDVLGAEESYGHYTKILCHESDSVWAVTKEEVDHEGVPAVPDPLPNHSAHAKIIFSAKPEKEYRKIAKRLKAYAIARGCQYKPS